MFRQDNSVVDGGQVVSLASFTFLLCQLDYWVSTLVLSMDTEWPVAQQWSPTPVGLSRFMCSLNLWHMML